VQCGLCTTQPIISQNDPFISVQFVWLLVLVLGLSCRSLLLVASGSRVANSPGLTRILRVSTFDLRSSGLELQSPGYGANCIKKIWISISIIPFSVSL